MRAKICLILGLLSMFCVSAYGQREPDRPLITVTGQAEVMVVPDEVVFKMTAFTFDKDLSQARARNDETVRNILAIARKYQVPPNLVQTGHISLEEQHTDPEVTKKPSVFRGYDVTKQIAIVLRDVSKAEALLGEIFTSGITRISSVEFRTTQVRKYKDQARAMAIKAAQEKATAFAREINQNIGKAYWITELGFPNTSATSNNVSFASGVGFRDSDDEDTIALGQISITARVTVSFELK